MHLIVVGLNHRSAPIEVRERLTFAEHALPEALRALLARPGILEGAILSTCNRTEVYAAVRHAAGEGVLVRFLTDHHHLPEAEFAGHLYVYRDLEAVHHLFRVASGLDSLVLGEPQILRQVRDAFACATAAQSIGPLFHGLFRAAITTGKRARTETGIGKGGFSIGHAAVDLARSIFGSLHGTTVLLLGAGKMSELAARHLVASGVHFVMVANRTYEKAVSLAERLGGQAIRYDDFPDRLGTADIVISSTASPTPVVHRETLLPGLRRRRGRPLFLIDIAVPRDIAPDVGTLDNVFLYDMDDLEEVVADMARERAGEAARVEAIIAEEAANFLAWRRTLDAAPVVTQLREKHEEIRQAELARLRRQLPDDLPESVWQRIDVATRSMMNRVVRDPIQRLKEAVSGEKGEPDYDLLEAAREIFALPTDAIPYGSLGGREHGGEGSASTLPHAPTPAGGLKGGDEEEASR